mgnify:CR=1 FL=1
MDYTQRKPELLGEFFGKIVFMIMCTSWRTNLILKQAWKSGNKTDRKFISMNQRESTDLTTGSLVGIQLERPGSPQTELQQNKTRSPNLRNAGLTTRRFFISTFLFIDFKIHVAKVYIRYMTCDEIYKKKKPLA